MQITSDKEMVFRKDYNGKPSYSLGLSKKDKDGKYINGYIKANFKKGTEIDNKTRIKINSAWIDFYKDGDKTIPTIFVNEYEVLGTVEDTEPVKETNPFEEFGDSITTQFDVGNQIQIEDEDLPF